MARGFQLLPEPFDFRLIGIVGKPADERFEIIAPSAFQIGKPLARHHLGAFAIKPFLARRPKGIANCSRTDKEEDDDHKRMIDKPTDQTALFVGGCPTAKSLGERNGARLGAGIEYRSGLSDR